MSKQTKWGTSSWMKEAVEMKLKSSQQPIKQQFFMPDGQIWESNTTDRAEARAFAKAALEEKKRQLKEMEA